MRTERQCGQVETPGLNDNQKQVGEGGAGAEEQRLTEEMSR